MTKTFKNQVFFENPETALPPAFPVGSIVGVQNTKGDIGLEIEVEGKNLPTHQGHIGPQWKFVNDGSLRGEECGEYVLRSPLKFKEVPKSLQKLWDGFEKKKTVLDDSNRTSVHVHLNCQEFLMNRIASFSALYLIFEEVLTEWCGEHRVGNLFCLRAKDAPAIVEGIIDFIKADGQYSFSNGMHYSGFNISALRKFGSIEIRTMRGTSDIDLVLQWVNVLERLYVLSDSYKDPSEIAGLFSATGPIGFFETILGDSSQIIRNGIQMSEQGISDSMYEGIRMAQDLCYCIDWGQYNKRPKATNDPFNRSPRDVMSGFAATFDEEYPGSLSLSPSVPATGSGLLSTAQQAAQNLLNELSFDEDEDEEEDYHFEEEEDDDSW